MPTAPKTDFIRESAPALRVAGRCAQREVCTCESPFAICGFGPAAGAGRDITGTFRGVRSCYVSTRRFFYESLKIALALGKRIL
jgi:hypothetical protein